MNKCINNVTLSGVICTDPTFHSTVSGSSVARLLLGEECERWDYKEKQNSVKIVTHSVVIFGNSIVEYVKNSITKGDRVYIEGELRYSFFKGDDGKYKQSTQIVLNEKKGIIRLEKVDESTEQIKEEDSYDDFLNPFEDSLPF